MSNASEIVDALAEKHRADVFVAECKTGSSWGPGTCRRLDAWAMRKSWSPWRTIGYEVKVSRSDFEQDQKWPEYLDVCHEFNFVCPAKLINAADLPRGIGLIWMSRSGRLHTKVKPAARTPDAEKLAQLMSYVLMSRARIVADMHEANGWSSGIPANRAERVAAYRTLVEQAEARKSLASFVGAHVRAAYSRMEAERDEAMVVNAQAEQLRESLAQGGITWDDQECRWGVHGVQRQIDALAGRIDYQTVQAIKNARAAIERLDQVVEEVRR